MGAPIVSRMTKPTIVAIGGHSLLDPAQPTIIENQVAVTAKAMAPVAEMIACLRPSTSAITGVDQLVTSSRSLRHLSSPVRASIATTNESPS